MALSRGRRRMRGSREIPTDTMRVEPQDPGESPVDRLLRKEHATAIVWKKRVAAKLGEQNSGKLRPLWRNPSQA